MTSPLLKEKSGQWFVVTPAKGASLSDRKGYEYPTLWAAEKAARETALRLAGKISMIPRAAGSNKIAVIL